MDSSCKIQYFYSVFSFAKLQSQFQFMDPTTFIGHINSWVYQLIHQAIKLLWSPTKFFIVKHSLNKRRPMKIYGKHGLIKKS